MTHQESLHFMHVELAGVIEYLNADTRDWSGTKIIPVIGGG